MKEMLQGVWKQTTVSPERCATRFHPSNWVSFGLILATLLLILICELTGGKFYTPYRGWYYLTPFIFFFLAFLGPTLRVARDDRYEGIRVVLFWGLIGLVFFVITFVAAYSFFAPTAGPFDRLLNILPAVIALWAAGLGWYTHYQITMKAHRTTHAFNLVMETRTSSEFVKNLRAFQLVYPPGKNMAEADKTLFSADAISRIPELEKTRDDGTKPPIDRSQSAENIKKIEAGISAKYLLNYFEFMARAIKGRDLDEEILYDTIGSTVVSVFNRTAVLRNLYTQQFPLAGEFTRQLVANWSARKRMDGAKFDR